MSNWATNPSLASIGGTSQPYENTDWFGQSTPVTGDYTNINDSIGDNVFGVNTGMDMGLNGTGGFLESLSSPGFQNGLGLAGLMMNGYNTFFGPQSDLMDQQIGLLKDKRAANQTFMDAYKNKTNNLQAANTAVWGNKPSLAATNIG